MHTKNINHQHESHHNTFTHFQPQPTTPYQSQQHQIHLTSISSSLPSSQQHQHVFPSSTGELTSFTMDSRRGSFQKKFRSMWFGSRRGKKGQQIDPNVMSKSLSSPALNHPSGFSEQRLSQSNFYESSWGTLPATLRHRANDDGSNPRIIHPGLSVPDLSRTLRNYKLALSEKVSPKEVIEQTRPKDVAPLETAIDDQYVVVVSDLDSARKYLMVKSQELENQQSCINTDQVNQQNTPQSSPRCDRAEDREIQSSSASESGRGTCSSEQNKQENVVAPQVVYAEVNKKDRAKKSEYLKSKYPQLYSPATRAPMPVVAESESWVSDSTCTNEKSPKTRCPTRSTPKKSTFEKVQKMAPSNYKLSKFKSDSRDNVSSNEDDTSSILPKNHKDIKNQIRNLQDMYGEIVKGMRSSSYNRSNLRSSRKMFGSASTLTSMASRNHRKIGGPTSYHRSRNPISSLEDSNRIKTLENHVTTLARSVTYLSSEIRKNERIFEEMESVRNEMNRMRQQMNFLSESLESKLKISNAIQGLNGESDKKKKSSKLSKLFVDQPTPLRQFLKHLGYEKYAIILEAEKIGLDELCYIPEEKLQKLGIAMGPRIRILQEIKQLQFSYNSLKRNKSSSFGQPHLI